MKAKIKALKKNYLVEFKNDADFLNFVTNFNDKIEDVEVINEDKLPELEKPVDVAKPSLSSGWETLNKSAFNDKEKGVEKKGMTLGGKYAEFKYEPDKTLDNAADDKVSEPKNDSPALKGDEPKVADVEATAKENEVKGATSKSSAPKAEDEPKNDSQKSETSAEKSEEPKSEEKPEEEKKEIKEAVEEDDNIGGLEGLKKALIMGKVTEDEAISYILDWGEAANEDEAIDLVGKLQDEAEAELDNSENDEYKEGYLAGQDAYDMGHYYPEVEGENSEEFEQGYEDGYNDAKAGENKFAEDGEHHGPFDEEIKESIEDEGFQIWVKGDSEFTECVGIKDTEEAAIEEAKRVYEEGSEDGDVVVFVNDAATGNTIFSTADGDMGDEYNDALNEVLEAAGVEEEGDAEKAKQWVLKTTIQLQTLKDGEIAPVEKRDVIAKELANAASIAFDTPVTNILKALQRDHKFFPNTSWK